MMSRNTLSEPQPDSASYLCQFVVWSMFLLHHSRTIVLYFTTPLQWFLALPFPYNCTIPYQALTVVLYLIMSLQLCSTLPCPYNQERNQLPLINILGTKETSLGNFFPLSRFINPCLLAGLILNRHGKCHERCECCLCKILELG